MGFSDILREILSSKKLKAVELSRMTGLSEAAISDYLNGKKEPRGKQSAAIAKALNVSLDELWETGYQEKKSSKISAKEKELLETFEALPCYLQDYLVKSTKDLLDAQSKFQCSEIKRSNKISNN
ncbi:XRE family transcriptional regulator [bacterium 1XD42-1]|nr:XRE family transcriptional regulator [bacterium 1XD42-8]RKJ62488.1 XRE family transcriptional regulator [bacterium 1XD42-1]